GGIGSDGRYLLHGREVWFYPHGRRQREATYEKGFRVGRETHWSPAGRVDWTWDHFPDGRAVWTQFWPNGRRKSVSTWRHLAGDGPALRWDASGRLLHHAVFADGRLLPGR
ncbi:MAG: toxin-antitoxin system YwqK family antitoxin, partial [Verrucomicrobiota bacterium]